MGTVITSKHIAHHHLKVGIEGTQEKVDIGPMVFFSHHALLRSGCLALIMTRRKLVRWVVLAAVCPVPNEILPLAESKELLSQPGRAMMQQR
jgi:hypothetical protein